MATTKIIPYSDHLIFNVYIIGYRHQGESIIFTLESDFGIVYSGVIDCYESDEINETIKRLDDLGVRYLDILCWTHPHEDHSFGIEKLLTQYVSEKTKIVYPNGINKLEYLYSDPRITKSFAIINDIAVSPKRKKPSLKPVLHGSTIDLRKIDNGIQNAHLLEIKAIAPVSDITEKRDLLGKVDNLNDYSIALLASIGGFNFLFGGDIQDTTIKKVDEIFLPEKIDYIKIPHHASKHSLSIEGWFDGSSKANIACTTEFTISKLPDEGVLNKYRRYFKEVYCSNRRTERIHSVGVIHTTFDVLSKKFYTTTDGDAVLT